MICIIGSNFVWCKGNYLVYMIIAILFVNMRNDKNVLIFVGSWDS